LRYVLITNAISGHVPLFESLVFASDGRPRDADHRHRRVGGRRMQGNGLRCSCRSCAGQCVPGEKLDLIENFLPDLYLLYVFVSTDLFFGLQEKMFFAL
jgi:hypothetical protein